MFPTTIATVDMVLWDGTEQSLVTASYGQYNARGVVIGTTEYATRAGSLLRSRQVLYAAKGHCSLTGILVT